MAQKSFPRAEEKLAIKQTINVLYNYLYFISIFLYKFYKDLFW